MSELLRVATLNVWALPWPVGHRVAERMDAIGAQLPRLEADAIAFQEVWSEDARRRLLAASRDAGLVHAWHNESVLGGGGLLAVTRRPIERARFERYELRGIPQRLTHGDYHGGKGFALLQLELPDGPLALVDTHFQARYAPIATDEYAGFRMGQVVQLAAALRALRAPVVALGDFNFDDDRPEYAAFTALTGLRDAAAELGRPEPTTRLGNPFRGRNEADGRIDYVFARGGADRGVRFVSVERIYDAAPGAGLPAFSDHDGVLAQLALEPAGATDPAPEPTAAVLSAASAELERGRARAEQRRRGERAGAVTALGLALAGGHAARRPALSRRRLLRAALLAGSGAALAGGLGLGALAELAVPEELAGYDRAVARLAEMGVPRAR